MPGRNPRGLKIIVGQRGGEAYSGIEQPKIEGVVGGSDGPNSDPLGIGLQQRGMEHAQAYRQAEFRKDPKTLSGPLPNPMWEGLFQALGEQGVDRIRGGPSAAGSNQLRGESVQPNYFTGGATFRAPTSMARTATNVNYQPRLFTPGQTIGGFGPTSGGTYEEEQAHIKGLKKYRV